MSVKLKGWNELALNDYTKNTWKYSLDYLYGNGPGITLQYMNSKNAFGISKQNNPFSKGNMLSGGTGWGIIGSAGGLGMNLVDNLVTQTKYGKKQTTGGTVLNTVGDVAISTGNPYAIAGGIIAKGVGTILNLGYGNTYNEEGIQDIKNNQANMRWMANGLALARNNTDFINSANKIYIGYDFDKDYIGDEGWWSNGVTEEFNKLNKSNAAARSYVSHALATGAENVNKVMTEGVKENTIAFGGPIDIDPSTAIGYQMYTDKYLSNKQKGSSGMSNLFAGTPDIFGFGGGIQSNGASFDNGISYVNSGGTHEENPYEGVQMGVDRQGVPNLVEEGEVKWNDYIFSNRLIVPRGKRGKLGKRARKYAKGGTLQLGDKGNEEVSYEDKVLKPFEGLTFADAAKKIIKLNGAEERNDAITLRGVDAQLSVLAGVQEKERQKEQLREMEEAIDNMSPEEFAMLQQQMEAQQVAKQQLEQAAMQLQMMPLGMEQMVPLEQLVSAFGGPIYNLGGLLNNWNTPTQQNPHMFAGGGFKDWWDTYINKAAGFITDEKGNVINGDAFPVDYGALYKAITGEEGPTTSDKVLEALEALYELDKSKFKPYDIRTKSFIEEATVEGPMAKVLKYKNLTGEDWNKLSDKTKERYLKQYRHSMNKTDRQAFDTSLTAYNQQQDHKRKVEEYQKALRESFLTKDDLKNFDQETLDRLAKYVNPDYTPADLKGLSENEKEEAHDKLLENIAAWSKENNKTLENINTAFKESPELYKDWKTVDYNDPDTWTSTGYDQNEFAQRTAAYNGSQTAGNLLGNYAPDANYNKDVFSTAAAIDNINDLEADPTYQAYTNAVKDALARNAGVRYRYKEGTDSGYENLEFADENKKISEEDYNLLHLLGRQVARTKTNPKGDPVPFFVSDGDYNKINEKIVKDGKEYTPESLWDHLRNDQKLGAMHLTPLLLKARDLYQVLGTDLYHTLELIGGENGDWRNYYTISDPVTQEDGTRLFTLTPKKGIKIDRVDSIPDELTTQKDDTTTDNDLFPKAPNWPYLLGAGIQAGALAYNALTPPNYDNANALIGAGRNNGAFMPISFSPIGHYLTYRPLDRLYQLNILNASTRATDRGIMNSGVNQGSKEAALLANAYANQIGAGNLFRLEQEYNDALRKQVGDFNKDTDKFNAEGILKADMADQDAYTRAKYSQLELLKSGYAMKQAADDAKANAINIGLTGLANTAFNYALNKYNLDTIDWMLAHNLNPISQMKDSKYKEALSRGGKVRRRRSLGF